MLKPRITPCLLVHDGGLVKTTLFANPTYVGDPINAVKIFNEKEADELILLDIDSTEQGVPPDYKLISRVANECRMPLCYGGGIKSVDQARKIIGLGVEKLAISSAVINDLKLIRSIANEVGSQSVVVVLDVRKKLLRGYEVFTGNGLKNSTLCPIELASKMEELGAGEVVINSIDNDGKMGGYDLDLALKVRESTRLPLSVIGGAGSLEDIKLLIDKCGVIGAVAGSLFVFKGKYRAVLINYPSPSEKNKLIK